MKIARLWVPLCLAGMVVGCGQKGPLVLPDTPKHKKVMPGPRAPAKDPTGSPSDTTSKP
jgi:predicted small lipoprotein YifL